ncbi:MAG: hypothetical protein V7K53_21475 [Nostoc sp.]|uniref:hypothetical protein n=1 Tax=Nostoc sp. TaxID=1180 RepID=UPI002FF51434
MDIYWELKDEDYKGAIAAALSNFNVEPKVADTFVKTAWALKDGNFKDVLDEGLSSAGFSNANQFVDIAWGVKDDNYQTAMAGALQRDDYFSALSTGFKVAGFEKGENLAKAALALRQGDPINAFYEGLSLVDGVSELVDTFKYLKDGNAKKAVPSMITAAPKLAKLFS